MPSGVAVGPGVSELYLSGAKAQILVTNQQSTDPQLHTEFSSYTATETRQHQSVCRDNGVHGLHLGRDVSGPKTFTTDNNQVKDRCCDNGPLPHVNSPQKPPTLSGHFSVSNRLSEKRSYVNRGQYLSQVTIFPPARHSAYVVTNDIDANSNHNGKTGKVCCEPVDTKGVEQEDGRYPSDQADGQWSGHLSETPAEASSSRSSKENQSSKPPGVFFRLSQVGPIHVH